MALRAVSAIFFQDESVFGDAVWRADAWRAMPMRLVWCPPDRTHADLA